MPDTFTILGSGAWGIAVGKHLADVGHTVRIFCPRAETGLEFAKTRERQLLLPGVRIPAAILITMNEQEAVANADYWIVATPTAYLKSVLSRFRSCAPPRHGIISLTKGLQIGTFQRPSEMIHELFAAVPTASLSGPSHAEEVSRGLPTSVVVASATAEYTRQIQKAFGTDRFRVYTSTDILGVELAGALKNVLAIAAGVSDGLGFGDNAKAALLTRGLVELTRFGTHFGADPVTFQGLAGLGDLIATCFSPHGRNRRFGERIARGESVESLLVGPQVVEGYYTVRSIHQQDIRLDMPITRSVYELLYEGKAPHVAVQDLMSRQPRQEGS